MISIDAAGVGVICVGAGPWGSKLVEHFRQLGALRAVCDSDATVRRDLAVRYPNTPIFSDLHDAMQLIGDAAVVIATPAATHAELAGAALAADRDVFVEKPLCLGAREARALVDQAGRAGRILMVGHLLWYHPAVLRLKEMITAGELGRLRYIYSQRLNLGRIRREESILWSFAPHDISVILGLTEERPEHVYAHAGFYLHERVADVTVSVLRFPTGVRAHLFVSWLHPFKEQKLVVVGDRRTAVFDDVEPLEKLVVYDHSMEWRDQRPMPLRGERHVVAIENVEPLRAECEHFLSCIRNRRRPRTDGEEAVRVLDVLDACQSAVDGIGEVEQTGFRGGRAAPRLGQAQRSFVHESSYVDNGVEIGEGTAIWHFCHILGGSRIGSDCRIGQNVMIGPNVHVGSGVKIQNNVSVYEGVTLEDHVFVGPSVVFTNVHNPRSELSRRNEMRSTIVRQGASLGANCTIVCGVMIGRYSFVGAGAVVTRDVADYALVAGNPARQIGWMCICGASFGSDWPGGICEACKRAWIHTGDSIMPASSTVGRGSGAGSFEQPQ